MFRNLLESVAGNEVAEVMTNCSDINHREDYYVKDINTQGKIRETANQAEIMTNYSDINHLEDNYVKDINTQAKIREIAKQELFKESKL